MNQLKELEPGEMFAFYTKRNDTKSLDYFDIYSQVLWGVVLSHSGQNTETIVFLDPEVIRANPPLFNIKLVNNRIKVDEKPFTASEELAIKNVFTFKEK